jgi:hypothetical protein
MSDEWPKAWDEITPDTDTTPFASIGTTWVDLGPLRMYDDTVYINPDSVWEGDNRDVWMPLGHFLAGGSVGGGQ